MEGKPKMSEQWRKLLAEQPKAPEQPVVHDQAEPLADLFEEIGEKEQKITALESKIAELEEHVHFLQKENSELLAEKEYVHKSDAGEKLKRVEKEVDRLNTLVKERDEQLAHALTPEAIEEVKTIFADAIYNMFAEVDDAEPGFITRMLANPEIEQESKNLVLEAFKVHNILLQ